MEIFRLGLEILMLFNLISATEENITRLTQRGSWLPQEMSLPWKKQGPSKSSPRVIVVALTSINVIMLRVSK